MLAERLGLVEDRIAAACRRAGRDRASVTLVAITKSTTPEIASQLPGLGVYDLGESRPQELWRKAAMVPNARWHFVGHLQRNKIERTLPLVNLIHSVDSQRLLETLEAEAAKQKRTVDVLLEVNASHEASKQGFPVSDLPLVLPYVLPLKNVHLRGLMTMAALEADPEGCRPTFVALRKLRDRLQNQVGPTHNLEHLSMGMSNDFEIAIEEGATLIRLGTVLFESLS